MNQLNLRYLHSFIIPCFCQAYKLVAEGKEIPKIKMNNKNNKITGDIMEIRVEQDDNNKIHEQRINHCLKCSKKLYE